MGSFGKNTAGLAAVGSFRQMSGQYSDNKRSSRGAKGGPPYFVDQYKPPYELDEIRLIEGAYETLTVTGEEPNLEVVTQKLPFIKFIEHYDGLKEKSAICSAGPFVNFKDRRDACAGCDIYWATQEAGEGGRRKSSRISRQQKYAMSMIDYGTYHKVDSFDVATGKPRMNPLTKKPYFNWIKCSGQGCDGCKGKLETKKGHNPHWPMSWGFFQTLRSTDRDIGRSCASCGGVNTIRSVAWLCANKECGEAAIDMRSTTLKADEIVRVSESMFDCKDCQQSGFLEEMIECEACSDPKRATLFDVDLKVKRVDMGANNQTILQISGWSKPGPVDAAFTAYATPKDLRKIFHPTDYKTQCEKFGWAAASEPAAKAYAAR